MDYFVREIKTVKYTQIEFEYIDRQLRFGGGLRGKIGGLLARLSVRGTKNTIAGDSLATKFITH